MSDEPQLNQPEDGEQTPAKNPEPSTRDLIREAAKDKPETHSEKRKRHREEILTSLPKNQDADDKSPEEIYQDQIENSYKKISDRISHFWEGGFTRDTRLPTRVTDDGTKIYVFDHSPSTSSLVAHNSDKQEIYQLIQLPPVDGKVKIVGLLYTPHGFEMAEIEAESEEFESEGVLWSFFDYDDEDAKNNSRPNAPILKYLDELSAHLHHPDHTLPFFVTPENIKLLTESYFPHLSEYPDVLTGPLPKFDTIEEIRSIYVIPKGNDPESVKARKEHFALQALVGEIEDTFDLAAKERPGSKIQFFRNGLQYSEIWEAISSQHPKMYSVSWNSKEGEYSIYKSPQGRPDLQQSLIINAKPGKPLSSFPEVGNDASTYDFYNFLNNLQKKLKKEAESKNGQN